MCHRVVYEIYYVSQGYHAEAISYTRLQLISHTMLVWTVIDRDSPKAPQTASASWAMHSDGCASLAVETVVTDYLYTNPKGHYRFWYRPKAPWHQRVIIGFGTGPRHLGIKGSLWVLVPLSHILGHYRLFRYYRLLWSIIDYCALSLSVSYWVTFRLHLGHLGYSVTFRLHLVYIQVTFRFRSSYVQIQVVFMFEFCICTLCPRCNGGQTKCDGAKQRWPNKV